MIGAEQWLLSVLIIVLCVVCLILIYFLARLRFKAQNLGSFNVAYRRDVDDKWVAGVCHYSDDLLKWYRIISLKWGSDLRWSRSKLEVIESAEVADEASGTQLAVLHCAADGHDFWLAMDAHDYAGVVSWAESSPPVQS